MLSGEMLDHVEWTYLATPLWGKWKSVANVQYLQRITSTDTAVIDWYNLKSSHALYKKSFKNKNLYNYSFHLKPKVQRCPHQILVTFARTADHTRFVVAGQLKYRDVSGIKRSLSGSRFSVTSGHQMPIQRACYVRRKSLILRLLVYGIGNGTFRNKCTIATSGHSAHRHYPRINGHVA
jgi:hypothetical protein